MDHVQEKLHLIERSKIVPLLETVVQPPCAAHDLVLVSCAQIDETDSIISLDAITAYERGAIVVVDVRSVRERHGGIPKFAMPHVQFGPDTWSAASDGDRVTFVARIRAVVPNDRSVALLCQAGIRSLAAAAALREHGIVALNIRDGYLGNSHGPGWKAWE